MLVRNIPRVCLWLKLTKIPLTVSEPEIDKVQTS